MDEFKWGVSTAAYQIEGAYNKDGKGLSIWDHFTARKGKIYKGHNGNIACDFYHKYAHDITLMKQLNIPHYRFSISWSRIMPEGTGTLNQDGIDFYNRIIDLCLELDIEPWITLYHWDLPQELENKGGWTNRKIIDWFSDYVQVCLKKYGDRVKRWMVLNEPMVFTGAGYFLGIHAPGKKGINNFLAAVHHAALCQAEGGRIIKSFDSSLIAGTTVSCSYIQPNSDSIADIKASERVDALLNRLFADPLAGKGYPLKQLPFLERIESYYRDGDEQRLAHKMDFIGVQNYTREIVAASWLTPFIGARIISADKRKVKKTIMNWEIYPEALYQMIRKFNQYGFNEIIVTENGAAFPDLVSNETINDLDRCEYLEQHILQVMRAREEGIPVNGYFVWSFTDNFEWAEGYRPRFGLVFIDFESQKRYIKRSGYWYSSFIRNVSLYRKAI